MLLHLLQAKQSYTTCSNWENCTSLSEKEKMKQNQNCCDLGFQTLCYRLFDVCILLHTECYWLLKVMLYNKRSYWTWSSSTTVIFEWHLWFALKCSGNKIWRMAFGIWSLGCDVMLLGRLGNTLEEPAASIIRVTFNLFYSADGGSRFLWNAFFFSTKLQDGILYRP